MTRRLWLPLVLLGACAEDELFSGTFDTPGSVAVLQPDAGPFDQPVGYAADRHGGRIRILALERAGNYLESGLATFFRGRPIATGRDRILGQTAARAVDGEVRVLAADLSHQVIFSVPHVLRRVDGNTFEYPIPEIVEETHDDADGSGDTAGFTWVDASAGRAASETWTLTWTVEGSWEVVGSRSGRQPWRAYMGAPFIAEGNTLAFQVDGTATVGDTLVLGVDTGLIEQPVDGAPVALSLSPDGSQLAVAVAGDDGVTLTWHDPDDLSPGAQVALPDGSSPSRMAWSADGSTLYVSDTTYAGVHVVEAGGTTASTVPLPWPTFDVAHLGDEDGSWLYVAPNGLQSVWMYDLVAGRLVDINRATPGVDGMELFAPVRGLEAIHEPYEFPFVDESGNTRRGRSVAISTHAGRVVWMEEGTGCLVSDFLGPRTRVRSLQATVGDYEASFDPIPGTTAVLDATLDSSRHVYVNPCAGIARRENWELRFDRLVQGWLAQGTLSGEQATPVFEDARWSSDNGAVHLRVRSGVDPSEDGWRIGFEVLDGVLQANGDTDNDGARDVVSFDLPGEPAVFYMTIEGTRRAMVAVSAEAGDVVARIDATTGSIDGLWD
jgi:hypothetical protein